MDITTLLGIIIGLIALIGGFMWEGGHFGGLFQLTSALIVFGGTFAAVLISFPLAKLRQFPRALAAAFITPTVNNEELIDDIVDMAVIARRSGVLALEKKASDHPNSFLQEGMGLVVDGNDHDTIKQLLEFEIDSLENRYSGYSKLFESAGGYAPTMGILGTVMGLIHVLGSLSEPGQLGPSIALAFTATLYGVASANLLFLPIASKIKSRCEDETIRMEMLAHGILSVRNGEHPVLIRKKLESFVSGGLIQDRKTEGGETLQ